MHVRNSHIYNIADLLSHIIVRRGTTATYVIGILPGLIVLIGSFKPVTMTIATGTLMLLGLAGAINAKDFNIINLVNIFVFRYEP